MPFESTITFRDMEPSEALRARIEQRVERLQRLHPHLGSCRVTVATEKLHQHQGHRFHVRIDVTAPPGHEVVVDHEPAQRQTHEDAFVAVRDAFDAMDRRIEDLARVQRGDVKTHVDEPHGTVVEIDMQAGHGRIESSDGRSIYFHRNAVSGERFESLHPGSPVRFVEEGGEQGPQASSVVPLGRHRPAM